MAFSFFFLVPMVLILTETRSQCGSSYMEPWLGKKVYLPVIFAVHLMMMGDMFFCLFVCSFFFFLNLFILFIYLFILLGVCFAMISTFSVVTSRFVQCQYSNCCFTELHAPSLTAQCIVRC